jgi:similar to stage IV sporulation protein
MRAAGAGVLRGYLTLRVRGYGVERFFHLCTNRGIRLWNLSSCGDGTFRCCIEMRDFGKLPPICRKTKTWVRIEKRHGLPVRCRKYRSRLLFFLAFFAMLGGVCRCSDYLWNIEITGNSYLSDETLTRFLKEQGIVPGMKHAEIDTDALVLALRQSYAQVIWSSAYVEGTSLVICIREQLRAEQSGQGADESGASDLVASKNARIASIITRTGTPCVVAGDEVLAGDVLVSAESDILDDNGEVMYALYQQADADVYGYVDYYFSESLPVRSLAAIDSGDSSRSVFLQLGGVTLTFPHNKPQYEEYYSISQTKQLRLLGSLYLPVCWGTTEYVRRETAYALLAAETAKNIAKEDFLYFISELEENGVSIIDKNVMIEEVGDFFEVSGHVLALEPVAETSPTEIPPVSEEQLFDEHD